MALTKESSGQAPRPRDRKRDRDHKQGALEEAHGNGRVRIQRLVNPRSASGAQGARSVRTQTRNPRGQARSPQTFRGETCAASLSQQGQDLFRPRSDETGGNPWGTHPGSSPHPVRVGTPGTQTFPRPSGPQIRNVPPGSGAQACGSASRRYPTSRSNFTPRSHPTSRGNQAHVQGLGQLHAPSGRPAGTPPGWFRAHPGFHGTPPRHPASRQQPVRGLPGNGGRTPRRAAA